MKPLAFENWQLAVNVESEHDIDCYCEMCNSAYLQYCKEVKDGHTFGNFDNDCEVCNN